MVDKKYQIFISSTFADLKEHRQAAMNAVVDLRHIPIGMEGFPAVDQEQMAYITRLIDECDYYVLIIGERYGSISTAGLSFTELEYDYAVKTGKHVLAFLSDQFVSDNCDDFGKLSTFRAKVAKDRIVKFWTNKDALALAVVKSLSNAFEVDPRDGWIRASNAVPPEVLTQLADAHQRIANLERELVANTPRPVPNLAGLDDQAVLRYAYKLTYDGRPISGDFSCRWHQLFLGVASTFRVAYAPTAINLPLIEFLSLNGRKHYSTEFTDTERARLLNQFELLGLMQSHVGKSLSGNYGVFYQLTAQGEALRTIGLATVRQPVGAPSASQVMQG